MITFENLGLVVGELKNLPIEVSVSDRLDDDEVAGYLYLRERYKRGELKSKGLVLSSMKKPEGFIDLDWGGFATKYTLICNLKTSQCIG